MFSKSRMKLSNCRAFWRTELNRESALQWMCVRVCVCVHDWHGNSNTSPPPPSFLHSSSQPTLSGRAGLEKYKQEAQLFPTDTWPNEFIHAPQYVFVSYLLQNPLPILGLERFPIGVVASDWCSPPGYLWRSFPKTALNNLFPRSTYCRLQEEVI